MTSFCLDYMTLKGRRGQNSLSAFAHCYPGFSSVLACYCCYQIIIYAVVYESTHFRKLGNFIWLHRLYSKTMLSFRVSGRNKCFQTFIEDAVRIRLSCPCDRYPQHLPSCWLKVAEVLEADWQFP